jgi:glycosyltransferase involved in cell wall biosynthesis
VSVVIPCYDQARFLGEAIESVLAQTYRDFEVIVVNDGSPDDTEAVVAPYCDDAGVRYVRQANAGVSAARNAGLRESRGDLVVFLDADDRLLPQALEIGVEALASHPDCAFVWGHCSLMAVDGTFIPSNPKPRIMSEHYSVLLRNNYIRTPGSVMYRSAILREINGFEESLRGPEDYDLHLRITRKWPVYCHDQPTTEYRVHPTSRTQNSAAMLKQTLLALRRQRTFIGNQDDWLRSYRLGVGAWQEQFGGPLIDGMLRKVRQGNLAALARDGGVLLRFYPQGLVIYPVRRLLRRVERTAWNVGRRARRAIVLSVNWLRTRRRVIGKARPPMPRGG